MRPAFGPQRVLAARHTRGSCKFDESRDSRKEVRRQSQSFCAANYRTVRFHQHLQTLQRLPLIAVEKIRINARVHKRVFLRGHLCTRRLQAKCAVLTACGLEKSSREVLQGVLSELQSALRINATRIHSLLDPT